MHNGAPFSCSRVDAISEAASTAVREGANALSEVAVGGAQALSRAEGIVTKSVTYSDRHSNLGMKQLRSQKAFREAIAAMPAAFIAAPGKTIEEVTRLVDTLRRDANEMDQAGQLEIAENFRSLNLEAQHAANALLNTLSREMLRRLFYTRRGEFALRMAVTRQCKVFTTHLRVQEIILDAWRGSLVTDCLRSGRVTALILRLLVLLPLNALLFPIIAAFPPAEAKV